MENHLMMTVPTMEELKVVKIENIKLLYVFIKYGFYGFLDIFVWNGTYRMNEMPDIFCT